MKHKHLDKIKSFEAPPKKINIFSEKEIIMIRELYNLLPERTYNKKQNVRKKGWEQNYNKDLDKIYEMMMMMVMILMIIIIIVVTESIFKLGPPDFP